MAEDREVHFGKYTSLEVQKLVKEDPVIILPVGAFEQHGPHLTLQTDVAIGRAVAEAAAARAANCFVLPPIWTGVSAHHLPFPGTITLRHSTLFTLVYDVVHSLLRHGFTKILILNAHGGNIGILKAVVEAIGAELGVSPVLVTYWHLIADRIGEWRQSPKGGISHACELETSLQMYLNPDEVREDLREDNLVPGDEFFGPDMFAPNKVGIYVPYDRLSSKGHIGMPTMATREKGKLIFDAIVDELVRVIAWMHKRGAAK